MRFFTFFTKISKIGYLVALVTLLTRIGLFMTLPFLAVYLARDGILSPSQIGMVIGISGFVFSISSLFNGAYVDRRSPRNILIVAIFLSGFAYFAFAYSTKLFFALLITNAALGWFRSLADMSVISILISTTQKENLTYAYSARFIAVNLGLVFGPLIGAVMAKEQSLLIFYIAGSIHMLVGIVLCFLKKSRLETGLRTPPTTHLIQNFRELWKNKLIVNITFINFIIWVAYSQIDSTIPQFLTHTVSDPAILVSKIMIINAVICVLFQPIIMRCAEIMSVKASGYLGCLLFSSGFLLIGIIPTPTTMLITSALLSFGELFTLPVLGLLVMHTAPSHLIASYSGLVNLGLLGISLGPIIGGFGLEYMGGKPLFLCTALLPLIVMWQYKKITLKPI
jgi:MFS family permease